MEMLVILLIVFLQQQPTEIQRQLGELQKEIEQSLILAREIRSKSAEKEVNRQESRAKKLLDRRNARAAQTRVELTEVREANRKLNAKLRAKIHADRVAKELIEAPEIRIAREAHLRSLLLVEKPTEDQKLLIKVLNERNEAQEKIRRQNNRRMCRWFRIGCIGRK
jgi:hypothetical protein